jgi:rhamnosyl/mannosyltransferase
MTSLRIVHLGKYYPPASGGIEQHTRWLARGQVELGAEVAVVVVNHANPQGRDVTYCAGHATTDRYELDGAIQVYRIGRRVHMARWDVCPGLCRRLRRLHRDFQPHLWHLHTPNITMMLAVLNCPVVRPLVITHHSDIIRQRFLKYLIRPFEWRLYRLAQRIFTGSAAYVAGSSLLSALSHKVVCLPLGIDLTPYQQVTERVELIQQQMRAQYGWPLWLCVGRMVPYKGHAVALQALLHVPGQLLLIGTGPLQNQLRHLAERLGIAGRVHFYGPATDEELIAAYRAATALWFTSLNRAEGFGLVQVEAMASGCPVINTSIAHSGVTWVCRHEQEGLTVPPGDATALAGAARRLLNEPALRERLAAAGRERAGAEFDYRRMAAQSLTLYQQALASKTNAHADP